MSASSETPLSAAQRRFLLLTAGVNGAAIMVVEILGAKMLAPYLGTSHFVWTAQIGIAMASLAFGYYLGGLWADSKGHLNRLYVSMLVAAAYLCLAIWGVQTVAVHSLSLPLPVASLLASAFLFFVPLSLLALTCPFLIRFLAGHVQEVGGQVGRLSAISTVGSFAGTALIGYVLIPLAPNSVTMVATAGLVAAVAVVHLIVWGGRKIPAVVGALIVIGLGIWSVRWDARPRFSKIREVYRGNSNFGQLQVLETVDGRRRFYANDYLIQNSYLTATKQSGSLFTYAIHQLARSHCERVDRVLCIGMGVGIVPSLFAQQGARVDVVEINPAVVTVAQRFFDLDPSRFALTIGDGRQFLRGRSNEYDAVVLDAFLGDSSPAHLMTREAFRAMKDVMKPEGVLSINCFGDPRPGHDFMLSSLERTLRAVFASVELHQAANGNAFFVASAAPLRLHRPYEYTAVAPSVLDQFRTAMNEVRETDPTHGIVLTDDFNPVDFHDAQNRERQRRELAQSMQEL